ncbi:uncharacterized protein [Mytilus edulis]|uniref:uncharacterized protein n=1 Tax=Mytilus edulis TaxID=6550 RepID=UPI0039EEFE4D
MADKNMVSLITELERRYLECSICTEVFDEDGRTPRLLPCHHSFCSECIKRLGRRKDTLKCPSCNAVHKVESPIDFPKDNTRRDLTSFLQTHSYRNAFKKCCKCGRTVDVTHTCQQCKMDFCEICRQQHITENKSHSLIVNNSETFQEKEDNFDICQIPNHDRAKLKYFCNSANCQSVLCPSCALEDHREISKHALEDIEEVFKKRKQDLGIDVESLRTQILRVKYKLQKVQKTTGTLQDEGDKFHRNLYPIYDRNIKRPLDQYDIAFQRIESKLVTRKDYLCKFLKNASECCSLSEQLINCNSISSFLNVHPTVDGQLKLYLNTQVDSTEDEIDLEVNKFVDDSLRLFERSIQSQENHERDDDEILLVNQVIGNHQDIHLENTIHAYGKNIFLPVATSTSYFIIQLIRIILHIPIKIIINIAIMPVKLITNIYHEYHDNLPLNRMQSVEWQIEQANQIERQWRNRRRNRRRTKRAYNRQYHDDENNQEYCNDIKTITAWPFLLLLIVFLVIPEIALIPLGIREHGKLTELKFDTQVGSQFTCRSADNQTVATVPSEHMLCGSRRRLFKFQGGFSNSSFSPKKESSIEFSIRFHEPILQLQEHGEVSVMAWFG